MTDNEIVKALLHCAGDNNSCKSCALYDVNDEDCECSRMLKREAVDLIKRQKAEIERLNAVKKHIDTLIHRDREYPTAEVYNEAFFKALERLYNDATAKAEAIKEFAGNAEDELSEWVGADNSISFSRIKKVIDNLAKEMVGDEK